MDTNILRKDYPDVTEQEARHGCYEGVVYIGHLVEDEHGEEVEAFEAVPCRRCNAQDL